MSDILPPHPACVLDCLPQRRRRERRRAVTIVLATVVLLLFAAPRGMAADDYDGLIAKAHAAVKQQDYRSAETSYRAAFTIHGDRGVDLYNAACAAARAGDTASALAWLRTSLLQTTWPAPLDQVLEHVPTDSDLVSLHDSPEWKRLLDDVRHRVQTLESKRDRPLQTELEAIFEHDQSGRLKVAQVEKEHGPNSEEMRALWRSIADQDAADLQRVSAILDKRGWLGADVVGLKGNSTLFLVVQHADLATQKKYLPLMRDAVAHGNARPADLALLEDRVALRQGHPQLYGSQISRDPTTGTFYVEALADPDHVDERRASVGLPPLASYVKAWNITWNLEAYKRQLPELLTRLHPEAN